MFKTMRTYFEPIFYFAGTLASIVALSIFGVNDPLRANIVLGLICLFLFLIFLKALFILNSFLRNDYPQGYITDSVSVKYSTKDGNTIDYELYKHIQIKRVLMDEFMHGFHWSGTQPPNITSHLQQISSIQKSTDDTWDKVFLKFESPLKYNDCETIHIAMKMDDADHRSGTHIESRVVTPLKVLTWRVELHYKPANYQVTAKLKRKRISDNFNHPYEEFKTIAFDSNSKSYEVTIPRPCLGYFYRLEWER